MLALREFATVVTHHKANLAETYANLLAERGDGYEQISKENRIASARKLLQAITECFQSETTEPFCNFFDDDQRETYRRWSAAINPPTPQTELDCLGETLIPVLTNLDAGKFLWKILAQARSKVSASPPSLPYAQPVAATSASDLIPLTDDADIDDGRLRLILDTSLDAVITINAEGEITEWNKQAETIFGWSREAVIGQRLSEIIIPEQHRGAHERGLKHFLATGEGPVLNRRIEITALNRAGDEFPVELAITPIKMGDTFIFSAFIRDITNRQQVETALRESEEKYRTILESIEDGYYEVDLAGNLTFFNDALCNVLGYPADDLIGMNNRDYTDEKNARKLYQAFRRVFETGEAIKGLECEVIRRDGSRGYIDTSVSLMRDTTGQPFGFRGIARDTIERRRTAEQLRESEALYQSLVDGFSQNVYRINRAGQVVFGNKTYLKSIGMTMEEVRGKTAYDFFPKALADKYTADDQWVMETGKTLDIVEDHHVPSTNETVYVQTLKTPVRDHTGQVVGVQGVFWDVTERKRAEESLARRATQLEAVAKVSTAASTLLEVDTLLEKAANLIRDEFDFYYVGFFLVDEAKEWVVLQKGTGEAGRIQLEQNHRLKIGGESMIGWSVLNKKPRIALDVGQDAVRFQNPILPDTRSELALPLISRGDVIGALTVQSVEQNAFSDEDITALQTMAEQLANAITTARQFEQTQLALRESETLQLYSQSLTGVLERDQILEIFNKACTDDIGFEYVQFSLVDQAKQRVKAIGGVGITADQIRRSNHPLDSNDIMADIIRTGETEIITGWDERFDKENFEAEGHANWVRVFAPIILRGERIGLVEAGFKKGVTEMVQESRVGLLKSLISQSALALDNAQRYEARQRALHREQTLRQITDKMRAAISLEQLIKTTAEELSQHFMAEYALVDLGLDASSESARQGDNGQS